MCQNVKRCQIVKKMLNVKKLNSYTRKQVHKILDTMRFMYDTVNFDITCESH